jgi:hypothetical protein
VPAERLNSMPLGRLTANGVAASFSEEEKTVCIYPVLIYRCFIRLAAEDGL